MQLARTVGAAALGLALLAASGSGARAGIIPLGTFSGPATAPVGDAGLAGPFEDVFTFTIAPGESLVFSSALSTGFSNRFFIPDMTADLLEGGVLVEPGKATTVTSSEGFPSRNVDFDPILLMPGDYGLDITGTATGAFPGLTSSFGGSLTLTAAPVVMAEPASLPLLLGGLAALAGWTATRFQASRAGSAAPLSSRIRERHRRVGAASRRFPRI